jgi:hypothetical protein
VWQIQYLRALDLGAELLAEADRERLARAAGRGVARPGRPIARRVIGATARAVERTATSVACWAEARPA